MQLAASAYLHDPIVPFSWSKRYYTVSNGRHGKAFPVGRENFFLNKTQQFSAFGKHLGVDLVKLISVPFSELIQIPMSRRLIKELWEANQMR